jgi:carbamoyltransferase
MLLNLEYRLFERDLGPLRRFRKRGFDHHLCHAATAAYTSPFRDGTVVVIDGLGEATSTAMFSYAEGELQRPVTPLWPNLASPGLLYGQVCFGRPALILCKERNGN